MSVESEDDVTVMILQAVVFNEISVLQPPLIVSQCTDIVLNISG